MKNILLAATILLSLNSFAQTPPAAPDLTAQPIPQLTAAEKIEAFKQISNFIPAGTFRGTIIDASRFPLSAHRCTGAVMSIDPETLSVALYENKLINLNGFSEDYHPNPVGLTYMTASDTILFASVTPTEALIKSKDKDGTMTTLEIKKIADKHAVIMITYIRADGSINSSRGCDINYNKKIK